MKYKKITDFDKYISNPFVDKAMEDIKIVKRTQVVRSNDNNDIQLITDVKTGEVNGYSAFMRFIEVDEEKFAKLYLSQFAAFWELSKPAIRVFGYILSVLKPNQDNFIFELDACIEHSQYKQKSMVFTGLANLMECGIIARTRYDHKYYINPLIVFNGNRVTFAKTYVKKKKQPNPNQIPLFDQNEDQAEVVIENTAPTNKTGMKRVEPTPLSNEEKDSKNWSNFTGDLKSLNVSEDRITEMIKLVIERMKDEQNGK